MDALRGKLPPLIIFEAPPRHGKSEYTSKWLPSWYLGTFPDRRVMLASYSDSLASFFGRHVRTLSDHYASWFGHRGVNPNVTAASEWELLHRDGGMLATGIGGPLTGRGAHLLVIDDPIKNDVEAISETIRERHWNWFQSTAWTRLEPGGVCVVMMTRWHEDDLVGKLVKLGEEELGVKSYRLSMPAICEASGDPLGREVGEALWPSRWPAETLQLRRQAMEDYWWESLYQQNPGTYGRTEWPKEYFDGIWAESWPDRFEYKVLALDPSKGRDTGDFAALVFLGVFGGRLWIDAMVDRVPISELILKGFEFQHRYNVDSFIVEGNAFQDLLADEYERVAVENRWAPLPIEMMFNMVDKRLRINRLGPHLSRKHFRFRRGAGCERLLAQLKGFPTSKFDDGPDALEMGLRHIKQKLAELHQTDEEHLYA